MVEISHSAIQLKLYHINGLWSHTSYKLEYNNKSELIVWSRSKIDAVDSLFFLQVFEDVKKVLSDLKWPVKD